MGNLFSYESKPMQILMFLGDLMILNFWYLICCIPLFTIGAAQAGLYTALRVLQDPEDDSSPTKAFFRGFSGGFKTITIAWGLLTVVFLAVCATALLAAANGLPLWLCAISVFVCALFQTLVPAFHSRFGCTSTQLIRNVWFLAFAHPLRSLGVTALIWLPVVVFSVDLYRFMALTPLWGTIYYSSALLFSNMFLKKPFNTLVDHFNKTHSDFPGEATQNDGIVLPEEMSNAAVSEQTSQEDVIVHTGS